MACLSKEKELMVVAITFFYPFELDSSTVPKKSKRGITNMNPAIIFYQVIHVVVSPYDLKNDGFDSWRNHKVSTNDIERPYYLPHSNYHIMH